VHVASGVAALAASWFIGPRVGHTANRGTSSPLPPGSLGNEQVAASEGALKRPANIPFVFLGTAMLWFGWFGFNAGSALAAGPVAVTAFFTTNTSSASAMLAWILLDYVKEGKASCLGACTAAVIGLVAITPAAGYVSVGSSIFIGVFSASFCYVFMASKLFKWLDDTLEVFSW
jgi:ammonia channel protein AmtB